MEPRRYISKYTRKQDVRPAWLYFILNEDKFVLDRIPGTQDFTVDAASVAVFWRAKLKGTLSRPPMEIESPKTGLYSTIFAPQERDMVDGSAFERLGAVGTGTYGCTLEDTEILYPTIDGTMPSKMPPVIIEYVDGIQHVFPGSEINLVCVDTVMELGDTQTRAMALGSSGDHENVQASFFMAVAPPGVRVVFGVDGVEWVLGYGRMVAWSPQDNVRRSFSIKASEEFKLFRFFSAGREAIDRELRHYYWTGSGFGSTE